MAKHSAALPFLTVVTTPMAAMVNTTGIEAGRYRARAYSQTTTVYNPG
jgi:hypothetical protein